LWVQVPPVLPEKNLVVAHKVFCSQVRLFAQHLVNCSAANAALSFQCLATIFHGYDRAILYDLLLLAFHAICCVCHAVISFLLLVSAGDVLSPSPDSLYNERQVFLHPFGKERNHSIGVIDHLIIGLLFDPNSGARAKIVLHMDSNLSSSRQGEKLDGDQSADDVDPTHPGIKQAGF